MIVLNSLQDKGAGFGVDTNKVTLLFADGAKKDLPLLSKQEVADAIIEELVLQSI
jgi:phosphopantothenoylcysteine decarboxylase/phosphopantothenate--cysteine ligase